jgi:hypothetical protein
MAVLRRVEFVTLFRRDTFFCNATYLITYRIYVKLLPHLIVKLLVVTYFDR